MVAANKIVKEVEIHYSATGLDQVKAKADAFAKAQDGLAKSTDAVGGSEERVARRRTTMAEAQARMQRQNEQMLAMQQQVANSNEAVARSLDGLARSQATAAQGSVALTDAANDNVGALDRLGSAFKAVGEFALKHPVLLLAGAGLAARGLSSLAALAGTALGAASASTARYAATSTAMGGAVAGAATAASRGLGAASTAATATSGGLAVLATRLAMLTSPLGLLLVGAGLLATAVLAVGSSFSSMGEKSEEVDKTSSKFAKLVELGKQSEKLDISGPFIRSFTGLGAKVELEANQMQSALEKASAFVRDEFEQVNKLREKMTELEKLGYSGGAPFKASDQLDLANNSEERIRAALTLMTELEERGHKLAAINIAEAMFGADFTEKLRTGQTTVKQFVADLDEASRKQLLKQEDVQRAVELSRAIEKTKREIMDVIDIRSDFSKLGIMINEWYLSGLQAIKGIVDYIAASIKSLGTQLTESSFWKNGTWLLEKMGVKTSLTTEQPVAAPVPAPAPIGYRNTSEMQGPKLPDTPRLKEAKQAAQEASSAYEMLIKRTQDRVKELELEIASVGGARDQVIKLKLAHDLERAALSSGVTVTKEMRDEWDKLGDKLASSTGRLEDSRRALESTREAQRAMADEFATFAEDITLGGQKIGDAFASLSKSFGSSTFKALLTGEGPLAGLYGTAAAERGQVGGLLGGKLNLGNLFDTSDITKALGIGAETGIGRALSEALKPQKANGGFASSKLGGGLTAVAAGASIGYSSASPLMGIAGGALAGASLGPWGAVVGGAAGLIGGLLGQSEAKKAAKKRIQEQLKAYRDAYQEALPQIKQLQAQLRGESVGNVGGQIDQAFQQAVGANKTASQGGDQAKADQIMRDFERYAVRLRDRFVSTFAGMASEIERGLGTNGPFAQAAAAVVALGDALKAFVEDAKSLPDAEANTARARAAAQAAALAAIDQPKTLSDTQARLASIQGTAAGLSEVLRDLGMSADDAAAAIRDRTAKAMDALRARFSADLGAKINDASGKAYLNEIADLLKERDGLMADAQAIGASTAQVSEYFGLAAQKIVNESELTGDAFSALVARFPALNGAVVAFGQAVDTAASKAEAAARALGYQDRTFAAGLDTSTLADSLAAFDRKADQERAAEAKAGGQAMVDLEAALSAERAGIIRDFAKQAAEAEKAAAEAIERRVLSAEDRLFAARNDTSTLTGRLAELDRQHAQERIEEVKAGGEAMASLEQAQAAERLKIVREAGEAEVAARKQALAEAQTFLDGATKTIRTYLDGLKAGSDTVLSPGDRLKEAQAQFERQMALARGGDREALGSITTYAGNLLEAGKSQFASGKGYQDIVAAVTKQLEALPSQVSAEQLIVNAINDSGDAIVDATTLMRETLRAAVGANNPGAVAAALTANFTRLDASVNGLLDYGEFLAGLGPLATKAEQQAAKAIFNAIDADGDGQISRLEAVNASVGLTKQAVDINSIHVVNRATQAGWQAEAIRAAIAANSPSSVAAALDANFTRLDTSVNGLLDYGEVVAALGPMATRAEQEAARRIFDAIDANGDGQLSRLELVNASAGATKSAVDATKGAVDATTRATWDVVGATRAVQDFNAVYRESFAYHLRLTERVVNNLWSANARSGAQTYAEGGWVRGPGSGTSDSIAARLSNGEFVVNAAAARLNAPFLEAMNDNRAMMMPAMPVPMMAGGGGFDIAPLVSEIRALRSEAKAQAEMIARLTKAAGDKVAGRVEDVGEEVAGQREDARRSVAPARAGRGEPVTTRAA